MGTTSVRWTYDESEVSDGHLTALYAAQEPFHWGGSGPLVRLVEWSYFKAATTLKIRRVDNGLTIAVRATDHLVAGVLQWQLAEANFGSAGATLRIDAGDEMIVRYDPVPIGTLGPYLGDRDDLRHMVTVAMERDWSANLGQEIGVTGTVLRCLVGALMLLGFSEEAAKAAVAASRLRRWESNVATHNHAPLG